MPPVPPGPPPRPLRDVDAAERAYRIRTLLYAMAGGVMAVFAVPFWISQNWPGTSDAVYVLATIAGFVVASAAMYALARLLVDGSAGVADALIFPGSSAPHVREYAYEDSLVIRGMLEEGAAAYRARCLEEPDSPTPRLRLARLLRDQLGRPEEAVEWFRAARDLVAGSPERDVVTTRELVEVYTHRLGQPRRALPELARAAERWKGTPAGEWAAAELAHWKRVVHGDPDAP